MIHPVTFRFSRRAGLVGASALAATALAACSQERDTTSGGGGSDGGGTAATADSNLEELMAHNPKDVSELEQGGTLTLTISALGPNYFGWNNSGNNVDNSNIYAAMDVSGVWKYEADGTPVLREEFCTDAQYDDSGEKHVITYTLNPEAKFNDGTPYDWKVFENQWKMMNGEDKTIDAVSTEGYDRIEKVEAGEDDFQAVVTMREPYQPWQDLFSGTFHPAINTPELFNDGFVDDLHPEWMIGPFTLEKLDTVQKRVTLVPNENWWGEKPKLDKIVWVQMESSATIPAFKNGEIDGTAVGNANRFEQVKDMEGIDIRRSQTMSISGINFNTTKGHLSDIEVRKAIYQGVNREELASIRFNGIDWSEETPGSWMLMPFSPHYQDNYPFEHDVEAAKKTLEDAGWVAEGDGPRSKDGETLDMTITTFGDDPITNAIVQTLQKQLQNIGFNAEIDARGSGDFGQVMADQAFQLVMMGYTVGSDPTGVVKQFFDSESTSNMTGTGSDEIDEMIPQASVSPEIEERAKIANECEKKFQELCAMMPLWNGPSIMAYKEGLANFGPKLFLSTDWSTVGWEKGKKNG
ncbi:ABC transporter family substrate-binding protein [Brachybacterium sp. Marseille-Q7125]|uniref:ABC transporter family substrate-binding protein n=1 Tax=Brachybacterium sp. Marseille-Q7125 TaxID=2932815 RepID=UPI001FF1E5B2|nr:ABC transporter family substrate-binding protein [Brachybacterium sp. Marseille-Q7125]